MTRQDGVLLLLRERGLSGGISTSLYDLHTHLAELLQRATSC